MIALFLVLGILISILLVLIILIQNPKGGGLDSNFGAANQLGSVRKTSDFVEKATWTLAVAIAVVSLLSASFIPKTIEGAEEGDLVEEVELKTLDNSFGE